MRIRQLGDPILRKVSKPVANAQILEPDLQQLIEHMKSVLNGIQAISKENGNALSAPQVGHLWRVILLRINGVFYPMINPSFETNSDVKFEFEEECFSLYDQRATISRYQSIIVTYINEHAEQRQIKLEEENAGLVQHEIDHLNGVLFLDHVDASDVAFIDTLLHDDPKRLSKMHEMIDYMKG